METSHEEPVLTIAGKGYTQDQAATMAFNTYRMSNEILDAGLLTWFKITKDRHFSMKDYAFLILFFLEKVATKEVKDLYKDHIPKIKEALK